MRGMIGVSPLIDSDMQTQCVTPSRKGRIINRHSVTYVLACGLLHIRMSSGQLRGYISESPIDNMHNCAYN